MRCWLGCPGVFFPRARCADVAIYGGPHEASFLRTHGIELVVQFLLFERFIKTSSSKKVCNKNDNSSKVAGHKCHFVVH